MHYLAGYYGRQLEIKSAGKYFRMTHPEDRGTGKRTYKLQRITD